MELLLSEGGMGFDLLYAGRIVLRHRPDCPAVVMSLGAPDITMLHGNYRISDNPAGRIEPLDFALNKGGSITLLHQGLPVARLDHSANSLTVEAVDPVHDRLCLRFYAEPGEAVWGGGEQFSYLALNGRRFPIWTSEPGVGRDKQSELTRKMDALGMAGGDYWTTGFPQPTILTSRWLAVHLDASCYSVLNFTNPAIHEVELWSHNARFEFFAEDSPTALVGTLSTRFGRQPQLPDWAIGGAIVGLKGGANSFDRLNSFLDANAAITGLWCEDWAGIRQTSFGRRLFWNWRWDRQRFPDLPDRIAKLNARGIRFLAYANPYLAVDGMQYEDARVGGHLVLRADGTEAYSMDFGEFDCGMVDLTSERTREWFAENILGAELLDIGIDGWMADFGEYLPIDAVLADGSDAMDAHNRWPVLWAQTNALALASRNKTGEALFFMRSGFTGAQKHCPLIWAGDQSVDFSRHDGIGTVISATLSAGLLGNAYSHSDCGGYTSLHGNVRSLELMQRWCELAAFAPVMRSHEGNRPDDNLQYDSTPELLACFAHWSRIHAALAPYTRQLCKEAEDLGLPVQRPLFLHYPDDPALWTVQDQFLFGCDLLVAPVIEEGAVMRDVILPGETPWLHLWSGEECAPGNHSVVAPIGQPPVFYRPESAFAVLFASLPKELTA